jgi:hypothetical protein
MASVIPPPRVIVGDNDESKRFRLRQFQVLVTFVTLLVTVWLCTLGWVTGLIGVLVAKHILVAVLIMGLGNEGPSAGGLQTGTDSAER